MNGHVLWGASLALAASRLSIAQPRMLNARQKIWGVEPRKRRARAAMHAGELGAPRGRQSRKEPRQLSLAEARTHGGPRAGSGRKRIDPTARPNVVHRTRPTHESEHPVHVTMRRRKGLPSLRTERAHRVLRQAVRDTRREGFRITHYSIQNDHLHIIVEARDAAALTSGMRSFAVRAAVRLNRELLGRDRGRVWGDRYHRRDLAGPRAVRNALVYVLSNHLKHGEYDVGLLDPCSSGRWFTGWAHGSTPPTSDPSPVEEATTWVLREGWYLRGGGRIHLGEAPRSSSR